MIKNLLKGKCLTNWLSLSPSVSHSTSPHTGDSTSRLALWNNLYHSPPPPLPPLVNLPPQREALNLGKRDSDNSPTPPPPAKRPHNETKKSNGTAIIKQEPVEPNNNNNSKTMSVNSGSRENSIVVSIDIGGIQYQGVLFAQSMPADGKTQHVPVSMST